MHIADMDFEMSPYNGDARVIDAANGLVRMAEPRAKVAIIGAGEGKRFAPYDDPEWEVWALNAVPSTDRTGRLRVDRWFEMHVMAAQNEKDMRWIQRCPVPIYLVPNASSWTQSGIVHNPQQVRYPLEVIEERFGSYFACSFAYQIGLALVEGFTDIGLYGCELCWGDKRERTVEWANVSWWLGLAEGMGKNIHLPPLSHLGQHTYRYGVEYFEEKRDVEHYVELMDKGDALHALEGKQREGIGG